MGELLDFQAHRRRVENARNDKRFAAIELDDLIVLPPAAPVADAAANLWELDDSEIVLDDGDASARRANGAAGIGAASNEEIERRRRELAAFGTRGSRSTLRAILGA